jgi:alpha(1,3/1,4) fucosyltransferase
MRKKLKLAFSDFWGEFEYNPTKKTEGANIFYQILSERFDIEISDNPDFLIYSVFGNNHQRWNCKKIMYTGENMRPHLGYCDYSISFDYTEDKRNLRFPLSAITLYENGIKDVFHKNTDIEKIKREKTKFCNFVFSNPNAPVRNTLLAELMKYKHVDSGGRAYNNLGYLVGDKQEFISQYKFTIAMENSENPGYTTEKLVHPKTADSIPIYWGNPLVHQDWNTKAFINAYEFGNIGELVEFIKEVDNDDSLYEKILMEPHFNGEMPLDLKHTTLLDFFDKISE